jgi:flagellar biosynthesis GTPase FlhF
MRFNAVLVQKALNSFANAVYYMSQAIEPCAEDIVGYNALLKAKQSLADRQLKAQQEQRQEKPKAKEPEENMKALKADLAREKKSLEEKDRIKEERKKTISAAIKRDKSESGLPDKPMKIASMEAFMKEWIPKSKAHPVKNSGGFAAGVGCSYQGAENIVKAVYSNGVAMINRRGTQYHRLVPVDQLDNLFLKDSGKTGKYAPGQKVEVGFGMKDSAKATVFRAAVINSIRGQSAQIKYLDTDATSSAKLSHFRPVEA